MNADELAAAGLLLTTEGPVTTITLHRPEVRNAQTPTMWRALAEIGAGLDDDTRVVVVRGSGAGFSAGLDRRLLDPGADLGGQESVAALLTMADEDFSATVDAYQQ